MVRHSDPGVPAWMTDSEEESYDGNTVVRFNTSVTESVLVTYNVSHEMTIQELIDEGFLDAEYANDEAAIHDAVGEAVANDYVDRFDDNDPYHGDSDYYDSDWDVDSIG